MVQRTLESAPRKGTSATMKTALIASVAAHAGIFGYAFLVWASPDAAEAPVIENVSVDIIDVADETRLTLGDEAGEEEAPEAIRTVEAEATADTAQDGEVRNAPVRNAPVREVAREPRPAPAPAPSPPVREIAIAPAPAPEPVAEPLPQVAQPPEPEAPAAAPEPEVEVAAAPPAPRGRPAGLRPPAPETVPESVVEPTPQIAEVAPQPQRQPTVQPTTPQPAQSEPRVALVQPVATAPTAAPGTPTILNAPPAPGVSQDALLDTLDPDRIAALLNKAEPIAAAPEPTQQVASASPSLGAIDGTDATLTLSEIGALRRQLARCWTPPLGARGAETLTVKVSMDLNPDGTVRGAPRIVDAPFGPAAAAASNAATRAVLNCQPYALPAEKYDLWQNITINFDPRQMLGL